MVESLRARGGGRLWYRDGLSVFGLADVAFLEATEEDVHPMAADYIDVPALYVVGERLARAEFGAGERLLPPGRVAVPSMWDSGAMQVLVRTAHTAT